MRLAHSKALGPGKSKPVSRRTFLTVEGHPARTYTDLVSAVVKS